jgi:4-nitrophenyl phosphatase
MLSGFLGEVMLQIKKLNIKAVILDMDGVLWRLTTPLVDVPNLFEQLSQNNIKVMFATNNGTATIDQYVNKLAGFGVQVEAWQVVTSAMAAGYLLKKTFPSGGPLYIMGEKALHDTLKDFGFYHSDVKPLAVAAGLTRDVNYNMLKDTSLMIQKGLPFYFTNPDPTYPTPEGNLPGAGTILAALETASGVKAKLAGKPLPFLFELAMERLGYGPEETLVIGDRLDTDIQGGQTLGCKTAMVLTGVSTLTELESWTPKPDLVIEKVSDLFLDV